MNYYVEIKYVYDFNQLFIAMYFYLTFSINVTVNEVLLHQSKEDNIILVVNKF